MIQHNVIVIVSNQRSRRTFTRCQFEKSAKYLFVKLKSIKNYSHQSREKGLEREI